MKDSLINSIIQDTTDKGSISDGTFTFGELHSDRLSLLVSYLNLIGRISELKGLEDYLWISHSDYEGVTAEGFIHIGFKSSVARAVIGAKVPEILKDVMVNMGARELMTAPKYPRLNEALNFYLND